MDWSEETKQETRDELGRARAGFVKSKIGQFGLFNKSKDGQITIKDRGETSKLLASYENIESMIAGGWVIDNT